MRADYRAALVACVVANAFRGKDQPAASVEDLLLRFDAHEPTEMPTEQMRSVAEQITAIQQSLEGD